MTLPQAKKAFREAVGYDMPASFTFMGSALIFMVKEMRLMFKWFADTGYGADIKALRREVPEMQDFGTWVRESSGFRKE